MLKTESYKRGVIYSTTLNIIAKATQFLTTLTIAFFFGTTTSSDIFYFVIGISALVTTGMLNGIDNIIIIPQAMKLREKEGEASSRNFMNFFIFLYVFIGLAIFIITILSPVVFYNTFSKFPKAALTEHRYLLYAGSMLILFQLINNFLGSVLSSYKYFTITILTVFVTSILSIIITVLFHAQLGITGTLYAVAISYGLNFIFLIAVLKVRLKWQFGKFSVVKDKKIWGNIGLMQLNILPVWIRNYITIYLLTGLGVGIFSAVTLSQQVSAIIETFIISQVLAVAGIKFNELYAKGHINELNKLFITISDYLFLLVTPIVLLTYFYSSEIAAIVFKRGYMQNNSIETVALCLKYLILLAPLTMLNNICTRIFSAAQIVRQSLFYSILAHIIFLILTIILIYTWELKGYLYSMIAGYMILVFLFYRLFKLKLKEINFDKVLILGFKQFLINFIIAWPVHFLLKNIINMNNHILLFSFATLFQLAVLSVINRKLFKHLKIKNFIKNFRSKNVQ